MADSAAHRRRSRRAAGASDGIAIAARDTEDPERKTKISYDAQDPSEHSQIMQSCFMSYRYWGYYNVPAYDRWLSEQNLTPAYRYLERILKLLAWRFSAETWNLKHPSDILAIPEILNVWPNARLVWAHRDPGKTIPSVASFIATERKEFVTSVNTAELGKVELRRREGHMSRVLAARAALPEGRVVDVYNLDLVRDPIATMAALYEKVDLPFTDAFARRLADHIRSKPKGRFGEHRVEEANYGISAEDVRQRFADYIAQCRVPIEM